MRQLALSIAIGKKDFLGFKINSDTKNVIYVSTEDDKYSTKTTIKKQLEQITESKDELNRIPNLNFIFDTDNLLTSLTNILSNKKVDLIIIDAFADVYTNEINSNTQVRNFLSKYHKLAIKNECLIIFLHHTGKRTEYGKSSKNNIIGSQAFEAKMRSVLELRQSRTSKNRNLTVLKCNFLPYEYKKDSYVLTFNENLIFENTNTKVPLNKPNKKDNSQIIKTVLKLSKKENLSIRKIEERLKGTKTQVSKSTIANIIKDNK